MNKLLFLLIILLPFSASSQSGKSNYPQNYFRFPLDLSTILSGNFGELRSNHFHSGLDIKTNQREGFPVYAVADGYVSRVRVQLGGGGNALYLNHPNGFTSVYMHLRDYSPKITDSLRAQQRGIKRFDVDFPLDAVAIPVKKGEVIAWSGNSGGSSGPHLHFELRDTKTEETINPQLFGLTVPDRVKPVINSFYVYQLNDQPFSEHTPRKAYALAGSAGKYNLNPATPVKIGGLSGFGLGVVDMNSASQNTNGPYSIELIVDGISIYCAVWEKFSFLNSRGINSHLDYPLLLSGGRRIQKSFVEPGNPLKIYRDLVNNGLIDITDSRIRAAKYIVTDIAGNESILDFKIQYDPSVKTEPVLPNGINFKFNEVNTFRNEKVDLNMPINTLYSDLNFVYSSSARPLKGYSQVHHIHNRLTPLHNSYRLAIKADENLTPALASKALLVNTKGIAQGGKFENGYVKAEVRSFDSFYIAIDNTAPRIVPVNISEGKSMAGTSKMQFRISDDLSGIQSVQATIDGEWVLMEYDPKNASLWHTFDPYLTKGKHEFELVVIDAKSNSKSYKVGFFR